MHYNKKVGQFGEKLAREFLERKGYKILEINYKASYKELDIIAEQGGFLVFVEVKTRTTKEFRGEDAVEYFKQENLNYAIENYLQEKNLWEKEVRADLIVVDINKINKTAKIKHYKDIL